MMKRTLAAAALAAALTAAAQQPSTFIVNPPPDVPSTQVVTIRTVPEPPPPQQRALKTALVVQNHVAGEYRPYMDGLADLLTAEFANRGYLVVNPANAVGSHQNDDPYGESMPDSAASRLAQTLGADYLVTASLRSVDSTSIGVPPRQITTLKLRMTLSITTGDGFAFAGENLVVPSRQMTPTQLQTSLDGVVNDMLDAAAAECVTRFTDRIASRPAIPEPQADFVTVAFTCNFPGADVQVDGVSYGTLPLSLKAARGVHNLRVSYPFCIPWDTTVNFQSDGQQVNVSLELSPEGYARWKDRETVLTILQRIRDSGATDDYARRVLADGNAEFLRNSHFKWDGATQTLTIESPDAAPIIYNPVISR
jgi:hypothetical protein